MSPIGPEGPKRRHLSLVTGGPATDSSLPVESSRLLPWGHITQIVSGVHNGRSYIDLKIDAPGQGVIVSFENKEGGSFPLAGVIALQILSSPELQKKVQIIRALGLPTRAEKELDAALAQLMTITVAHPDHLERKPLFAKVKGEKRGEEAFYPRVKAPTKESIDAIKEFLLTRMGPRLVVGQE